MMNKVALITGGSRGIGFGIAKALAGCGYDLAINGVRPETEADSALATLREFGVKVSYCRGNIASKTERSAILDQVRAAFGRLNYLVNNAGVAPKERNDILETTEESYDFVMDVNLKGVYFLTQAAAKWLIEQKKSDPKFDGAIVTVSSVSATVASVNRVEYCLSKAGLSMLTQLFAVRLAEFDIPVFEVRPGVIKTDMTAGVTDKYDQLISEGLTLQKRWGIPADVGRAVKALLSGDFSYSTGQVVMVDGGLTRQKL